MTPMGRISTDLSSVFCGLAINEKTPFISPIRVIRVLFLKAE
jgi:hypothetical protein